MNGSTVLVGGIVRLGTGQQASKSPTEMILPSTKYLKMSWRPSSTSGWAAALPAPFLVRVVELLLTGASASGGRLVKLLALLSICAIAATASLSSGWRWRTVS